MMNITYVTGNKAKIESARQILEPLGFAINNIKMDVTEIQADTIEEIAKYSAEVACKKLNSPVLKNDSGLVIDALNGFPGPYTHYVDDTIGEDGILRLMNGITNRRAHFEEILAYAEPCKETVTFKSITNGTIAYEKSGTYGWSYDFIFIPDGADKTLGNYPDKERFSLWNNDAYLELAKYLEKKD